MADGPACSGSRPKVASLRTVLAILLAAAGLAAPAGALAAPLDPLSLYGPAHRFQVLRDGAPVGVLEVQIGPDGVGGWTVHSQLDLRVRLLGFTVYRLDYRSRAAWNAGGLQNLSITVAENDRRREITMHRDGDELAIDGPAGAFRTSAPLFPTDHWHPGVLSESRVLNTLTGRIAAVSITPGAWQPLATASGTIEARPYVYSGEVETEVWYDRRGRWVAMRFRGTDGSEIQYVCETCGCDVCYAPPAPNTAPAAVR